MDFPHDHYWHNGVPFEWLYWWGRLDNGNFFHFAEFMWKLGGMKTNWQHWSIDGEFGETATSYHDGERISYSGYLSNRFTFHSPKFGITFNPIPKPVIHDKMGGMNYYSIPRMNGEGHIYPDKKIKTVGWFDHEWGAGHKTEGWDWLSIHLDCGINITAYDCKTHRLCDMDYFGNIINSDFIIDNKHFYINELGSYLTLEPLKDEIVFKPKFGVMYSEQPFDVVAKGKVIGIGMRERTYKEKEDG